MIMWQCKLFLIIVLLTTSGQSFNADTVSAQIEELLNNKTFMEMFNKVQLDTAPPLQDFPCTWNEESGARTSVPRTSDSTSIITIADTSNVTKGITDKANGITGDKYNNGEKGHRVINDSNEMKEESSYMTEEDQHITKGELVEINTIEVLRDSSVAQDQPVEINTFEVLADPSIAQGEPVEINTIEVLRDPSIAQAEPVELNTIEVLRDSSVAQDEPVEINTIEVLRDPSIAQTEPVEINTIEVLRDSSVAQDQPVEINTIEVLRDSSVAQDQPVEINTIEVLRDSSVAQDQPVEINTIEVLRDSSVAQDQPVEINTIDVLRNPSIAQEEHVEINTIEFLRDPTIAQSVHRLRPSDIKVIAALGDSITAGRAAGNRMLTSLLHDYRGLSWSAGGDESYSTFPSLANILRKFNPKLYGFSTGVDSSDSRLNMAESGARSFNLPKQAMNLVNGMNSDPQVDINNDWKLITVLVGGNVLCQLCHDEISAYDYVKSLKTALDILYQLPRALVNVVQLMSVDRLHELHRDPICSIVQGLVCDCASFPVSESNFTQLIKARSEFQAKTEELLRSDAYESREDFAVVLQPFYRDSVLPTVANGETDLSYFAIDCFHPSKKGQAVFGVNLWNNMLEPVNRKRTKIDWDKPYDLKCPSQTFPYFYTKLNSAQYLKQDVAQEAGVVSPNTDYSIEILSITLSTIIVVAALGFAAYVRLQSKHAKGYERI